jgi:hypothetical protein
MEQSALMGMWVRPDGVVQPYQTCPRCSRVLSGANQTAREQLTVRIEEVLAAAIEAKQEAVH